MRSRKIARITVIGQESVVRETASNANINLNGVELLDHRSSHHELGKMAELYHQLRRSKGVTLEEAEQAVKDPLYFGNLLVREGRRRLGSGSHEYDGSYRRCRPEMCWPRGGV